MLAFLDVLVERCPDGRIQTSVYRKKTFSGLYLKWTSFVPKSYKRGLVFSLLNRAWNICSTYGKFDEEVRQLKTVLTANGYPLNFLESCVSAYLKCCYSPPSEPTYGPEKKTLTLSLPYCGPRGDRLRRQLKRMYSAVAPFVNIRITF